MGNLEILGPNLSPFPLELLNILLDERFRREANDLLGNEVFVIRHDDIARFVQCHNVLYGIFEIFIVAVPSHQVDRYGQLLFAKRNDRNTGFQEVNSIEGIGSCRIFGGDIVDIGCDIATRSNDNAFFQSSQIGLIAMLVQCSLCIEDIVENIRIKKNFFNCHCWS